MSKPLAVFTVVHNEHLFLPVWLRHYCLQVGGPDLYVLDHDSDPDHSAVVMSASATRVPISRKTFFDHAWLCETVARFQHFLLQSYKAVLFAEADELVFPDPARHPNLLAYANATEGGPPVVKCDGYNVWHDRKSGEPSLDWDAPLLRQRRWAYRNAEYCKPLFARVPVRWRFGFHKLAKHQDMPKSDVDRSLVLVHLHRACYTSCLARKREMATRRWHKDALRSGDGAHNRVVDEGEFDSLFDDPRWLGEEKVEIPAFWKSIV